MIRRLFFRLLLARRGRASKPVVDDPVRLIGEQLDLQGFRVEGLREALADAQRALAEERQARALEVAQLRAALAVALLPQWMANSPKIRTARLDGMKTSVVPSALIRKAAKGRHR